MKTDSPRRFRVRVLDPVQVLKFAGFRGCVPVVCHFEPSMTLRPRYVLDFGHALVVGANHCAPSAFGSSTQRAAGSLFDAIAYGVVTEKFPASSEAG
jgi:hypothetical protein